MNKLTKFFFGEIDHEIEFMETTHVAEGVECDVYKFKHDASKDLGIIRLKPGSRTPLQKVIKGDQTIEGYISGEGILTVTRVSGKKEVHKFSNSSGSEISINIEIGDTMQWEAFNNYELIVYEVCYPPYEIGRFEEIRS